MKTIAKNLNIGVVGGGISGLATGILLKMKGFNRVRVYQQDECFGSRRQGYGLTILQGKRVLRELGILEQTKELNSPTKAHYFFNSKSNLLGFYGTIFWDSQKQNRSQRWRQKGLSMHIPRQQLRRLLLQRFMKLDGQINWAHQLKNVTSKTDQISLHFGQSQSFGHDLVVGCDGIYSKLRSLAVKKDKQLNYLGVMVILGICRSDHSLSKERIFQSSDGTGRFYSMPFFKEDPQRNTMWQFSIPIDKDRAFQLQKNPLKVKQFMMDYCKEWHQPVSTLISCTQIKNIMTLPAFDREPEEVRLIDSRIVLTGDASHPMSPFKSQGANQALLDAYSFTQLLSNSTCLSLSLCEFQKEKWNRVTNKMMQSRQRVLKYHNAEYLSQENYLYPKIDAKLIKLLNQSQICKNPDDSLQQKIINIMKMNGYIS